MTGTKSNVWIPASGQFSPCSSLLRGGNCLLYPFSANSREVVILIQNLSELECKKSVEINPEINPKCVSEIGQLMMSRRNFLFEAFLEFLELNNSSLASRPY